MFYDAQSKLFSIVNAIPTSAVDIDQFNADAAHVARLFDKIVMGAPTMGNPLSDLTQVNPATEFAGVYVSSLPTMIVGDVSYGRHARVIVDTGRTQRALSLPCYADGTYAYTNLLTMQHDAERAEKNAKTDISKARAAFVRDQVAKARSEAAIQAPISITFVHNGAVYITRPATMQWIPAESGDVHARYVEIIRKIIGVIKARGIDLTTVVAERLASNGVVSLSSLRNNFSVAPDLGKVQSALHEVTSIAVLMNVAKGITSEDMSVDDYLAHMMSSIQLLSQNFADQTWYQQLQVNALDVAPTLSAAVRRLASIANAFDSSHDDAFVLLFQDGIRGVLNSTVHGSNASALTGVGAFLFDPHAQVSVDGGILKTTTSGGAYATVSDGRVTGVPLDQLLKMRAATLEALSTAQYCLFKESSAVFLKWAAVPGIVARPYVSARAGA